MTQHANSSASSKAILRRRAAVMAVGMGVSVVLGAGVALAAEPQADAFTYVAGERLAATVTAQVEGQKQAADAKAAVDLKKGAAIKKSPAAWVKPLNKYTIGSTFGLGGTMWSNKHSGQDFVAPTGTSVKAANRGTVVEAGWGGSYGNNIVIKHGNRTYTQYGHLSKIGVRVGQSVTTGQEIGKVGSTGNSTGPHLHFEARTSPVYGYAIEPLKFLREQGVSV
ncbi:MULTISPECIES: M23 family metallopeptidase [Streptomyces]|uniref:M23 family metallopeptidase n=1 Tax=Streptomyces TaxID=1883 RepID=UPI0022548478|nr:MULTISPECIES: M23 family metallopeptidase [Streptomyces]MCX5277710.1 M23 family metallopeptidase [Streptomyces virginiae]MCY0955265.1 M23 family metallopeptidase [Streptomyces sp. H27-S2]